MLPTLDNTDLLLLDIIQRDPHMTQKEIAKMVGKSISVIFERIKRLHENGFVRKVVAILDQKLINKSLVAFAQIRLKEHSKKTLLKFGKKIAELEEVMEAYHMSGECDFLAKIVVADMDEYNDFIVQRLSTFAEIASVDSRFVMNELKNENVYALSV